MHVAIEFPVEVSIIDVAAAAAAAAVAAVAATVPVVVEPLEIVGCAGIDVVATGVARIAACRRKGTCIRSSRSLIRGGGRTVRKVGRRIAGLGGAECRGGVCGRRGTIAGGSVGCTGI
jgi:hypothetical protein